LAQAILFQGVRVRQLQTPPPGVLDTHPCA